MNENIRFMIRLSLGIGIEYAFILLLLGIRNV